MSFLNERNEPTDLIQFMITEIQAQKIHSQEILQVIPLRLEELMATDNLLQKNLRPKTLQTFLCLEGAEEVEMGCGLFWEVGQPFSERVKKNASDINLY